jgi:hypothetical protein
MKLFSCYLVYNDLIVCSRQITVSGTFYQPVHHIVRRFILLGLGSQDQCDRLCRAFQGTRAATDAFFRYYGVSAVVFDNRIHRTPFIRTYAASCATVRVDRSDKVASGDAGRGAKVSYASQGHTAAWAAVADGDMVFFGVVNGVMNQAFFLCLIQYFHGLFPGYDLPAQIKIIVSVFFHGKVQTALDAVIAPMSEDPPFFAALTVIHQKGLCLFDDLSYIFIPMNLGACLDFCIDRDGTTPCQSTADRIFHDKGKVFIAHFKQFLVFNTMAANNGWISVEAYF